MGNTTSTSASHPSSPNPRSPHSPHSPQPHSHSHSQFNTNLNHVRHGSSRSGTASPVPGSGQLKRKPPSIDLPDLAPMMSATTFIQEQYHQPPRTSSYNGPKSASIPIPVQEAGGSGRKVNVSDYAVQPSAHMERARAANANGSANGSRNGSRNGSSANVAAAQGQPVAPTQRGRSHKSQREPSSRVPSRGRGSQYMHYIPSNLSIMTRPGAPPPSRNSSPVPMHDSDNQDTSSSVVERDESVDGSEEDIVVRSSIPAGLRVRKVEANGLVEGPSNVVEDANVTLEELGVVEGEDEPDRVVVKVTWHGEGQVSLAVAAGDSWDEKRVMEPDDSPALTPHSTPTSPPTSPPLESDPDAPTFISSNIRPFSTTVSLAPGTHYFRFFVNDEWRVAENLLTAVNDSGSLANYLVIGLVGVTSSEAISELSSKQENENGTPLKPRPMLLTRTGLSSTASAPVTAPGTSVTTTPNVTTPGSPTTSIAMSRGTSRPPPLGLANTHTHPAASHFGRGHPQRPLGLGYSFWSVSSTNDIDIASEDEREREREKEREKERERERQSERERSGSKGRRRPSPKSTNIKLGTGSKAHYTPQWTTEIPLELVEAATEEEEFLAHQNQIRAQMHSRSGQTHHVSGFIPLPNIPPAPKVPRHLEKLVLNSPGGQHLRPASSSHTSHSQSSHSHSHTSEKDSRKLNGALSHHHHLSSLPLPVTTASGTDVTQIRCSSKSKDRERAPCPGREAPPPPPITLPQSTPITAVTAAAIAISTSVGSPGSQRTAGGAGSVLVVDNGAALVADDSSVLPVPSHVVLHHLCTSAIRNGVLAVGQTSRYRQKYVTTVLYKPT